jgi:hypothetical protein
MKMNGILFTLAAFVGSLAQASTPGTNCLQWKLTTQNEFVTKDFSLQYASDILKNGLQFGMVIEAIAQENGATAYYFRYNRSAVVDKSIRRTHE